MIEQTLFPVVEVPAIGKFPDNANYTKELTKDTGFKFIMREDTGEILSCMTNEYKLVTNKEIIDAALPIIEKHNGVIREAEALADGKRTSWKFTFPKTTVKIDNNDKLNPEIVLRNSYDGFWELGILGGAFRLVCANGMVVGHVVTKKTNRHSIHNTSLQNLEEMIVNTVENLGEIFERDFALLVETKVNPTAIKKAIELIPDIYMEQFAQYLMGKKMNTFWDLHNALTWVNTHHMSRKAGTTHRFESTIHKNVVKWAKTVASA